LLDDLGLAEDDLADALAHQAQSRAQRFDYQFVVAHEDVLPYSKPTPPSGKDYNEKQHFRSTNIEPPSIALTARSAQSAPGYIFAAPYSLAIFALSSVVPTPSLCCGCPHMSPAP